VIREAMGWRRQGQHYANKRYGSCCKCDHAASSSGRFQSSASVGSLSRAVSLATTTGASSSMVTRARRVEDSYTGSRSFTFPRSSITASTVRTICLPPCSEYTNSRRQVENIFVAERSMGDLFFHQHKDWNSSSVNPGLPARIKITRGSKGIGVRRKVPCKITSQSFKFLAGWLQLRSPYFC
jgi:hypothetical protein